MRRATIADAMRTFTVTTEGENRLGLRELCQRYVNEHCVAAHMTAEQAAESVLDECQTHLGF